MGTETTQPKQPAKPAAADEYGGYCRYPGCIEDAEREGLCERHWHAAGAGDAKAQSVRRAWRAVHLDEIRRAVTRERAEKVRRQYRPGGSREATTPTPGGRQAEPAGKKETRAMTTTATTATAMKCLACEKPASVRGLCVACYYALKHGKDKGRVKRLEGLVLPSRRGRRRPADGAGAEAGRQEGLTARSTAGEPSAPPPPPTAAKLPDSISLTRAADGAVVLVNRRGQAVRIDAGGNMRLGSMQFSPDAANGYTPKALTTAG